MISLNLYPCDLLYLGRESMSPVCRALLSSFLCQIFTCVTSSPQERERPSLPALISPCLPQSINVSSRGCCYPSFPRSVLSHPSGSIPHVVESWKQQGSDRRMDGERRWLPWGFLTLFLSLTLSHQISISFSLMRLLDPSNSLLFSLSVPLNISSGVIHFVLAQSLSQSVLSFPSLPPFILPFFLLSIPLSAFNTHSVSIYEHRHIHTDTYKYF